MGYMNGYYKKVGNLPPAERFYSQKQAAERVQEDAVEISLYNSLSDLNGGDTIVEKVFLNPDGSQVEYTTNIYHSIRDGWYFSKESAEARRKAPLALNLYFGF